VVQKVIDIVGISSESFAAAAQDAVKIASESVREMRWARVSELEMELKGDRVATYRATVRIYFEVEQEGKLAGSQPPEVKAPVARAPRRKRPAQKKARVSSRPRKTASESEDDEDGTEDDEASR